MVQTKYDVPVRRTHKGNRICLYHFYFIYTEDDLLNLLLVLSSSYTYISARGSISLTILQFPIIQFQKLESVIHYIPSRVRVLSQNASGINL